MKKSLSRLIRSGLAGLVLTGVSLFSIGDAQAQQRHNHENNCGTLVYAEWIDNDHDGYRDWREFEEVKNGEKRSEKVEYKRNERIFSTFHKCPYHNSDGNVEMVLYSPSGEKVTSKTWQTKSETDQWEEISFNLPDICRKFGPGNYTIKYNSNGNKWQSREFKIVDYCGR